MKSVKIPVRPAIYFFTELHDLFVFHSLKEAEAHIIRNPSNIQVTLLSAADKSVDGFLFRG